MLTAMSKSIEILPVLAATTLGPALIVNALVSDRALPTWSRVLSGLTGVVAIGFGINAILSEKTQMQPMAAALVDAAQHELEHTTNVAEAMKIALDHLVKDPDYYKKLKAAGIG